MKNIRLTLSLLVIFSSQLVTAEQTPSNQGEQLTQEEQYQVWSNNIWQSINQQQGAITLPGNVATLNVPETFYYLGPDDSKRVLIELWGNPPGTNSEVLGMLFPANSTPLDQNSWAVTIEYEEDGYVSDSDADEIDYGELLSQMQTETEAASEQRISQGYESIELVGWASAPFYDKTSNKLHWAKELKFGNQAVNTLNYNIRVLGRKGVLVLNFIASMDQKTLIAAKLDSVLGLAEFNQGLRYKDFDPSIDEVAAYGLGALVAGKIVAKTGILAAVFIFLKKFGVIIVVGIGALFVKLLKRKKTE